MITAEQARKLSESQIPNILDKINTFFDGIDRYWRICNGIREHASNGYRYYITDCCSIEDFPWIRVKLEKKGYVVRYWQKEMKWLADEPIIDKMYYEILW